MPEIPDNQVDTEKLVRGLLVQLFSGIDDLPHVYPERIWIENENDAVRRMGFKHSSSKQTEFRVLLIDFENFEDTEDGCEAEPVCNLVYALKLAVSHAGRRPDGTTSTDDYARFVLELRDRVLKNRHFEVEGADKYERLRCENLEAVGATAFGEDEETMIRGHIGEFTLKVRVTPLG